MTAQRRRDPQTKQDNRRATGPGEKSKPGTVPSARRNPAASRARPPAVPPPNPGGSTDRLAAADAATVPPLGPAMARRALPPAEPSLLERAERLRDDLLRSKLTHPDPWSYTAKARAWGERTQALVEEIAVAGQTPALHATVANLAAEVEGDADFQKARQLF
jgi:hypothetical protein